MKLHIGLIFITILTLTPSVKAKKNDKSIPNEQMKLTKPSLLENDFSIHLKNKYLKISMQKIDSVLVNEVCAQKSKNPCLALKALYGKKNTQKNPQQNPAAGYCALVNGENFIAENSKGNQNDFCKFSDGSYILSWDLYLKHYPIPVIN